MGGAHRRRGSDCGPVIGRMALATGLVVAAGSTLVDVGAAETPARSTSGTPAASSGNASAGDKVDVPVPGTPCTATARACIDLASHEAWLIREGQVIRGPVAMMDGDGEDPTPKGTYTVQWKADHWVSREYGTPMPYSVFFAPGGVAFHEGRQDTPSAGCVKLNGDDAHAFFDYLKVGDEVQVR